MKPALRFLSHPSGPCFRSHQFKQPQRCPRCEVGELLEESYSVPGYTAIQTHSKTNVETKVPVMRLVVRVTHHENGTVTAQAFEHFNDEIPRYEDQWKALG
jgi:hypothetical protein